MRDHTPSGFAKRVGAHWIVKIAHDFPN